MVANVARARPTIHFERANCRRSGCLLRLQRCKPASSGSSVEVAITLTGVPLNFL